MRCAPARHVVLAALLLLPACAGGLSSAYGPATSTPSVERPRLRSSGERLPPVSGTSPASSGWAQVETGVWMRGDRLRTSHVAILSNAAESDGLRVAHIAESHVRSLVTTFGDALDLRLPYEPLPLVVHARRSAFQDALQRAAPGHPGWNAFYDPRRGTVHVCIEPAPGGSLPLQADVRHEMTHQILDLSTPMRGRAAIFKGGTLWLWEGFAAWSEGLGDAPGTDTRAARRERFVRRRARGEVASLSTLFALDQNEFEGRHYDQAAVLVTFLMRDGVSGGRTAVLHTLRDVLRGSTLPDDFQHGLGMSATQLDAAWNQGR